jgi:hypothetical protein
VKTRQKEVGGGEEAGVGETQHEVVGFRVYSMCSPTSATDS